MIAPESSPYQVFHSFYKEIQSEFPISVNTKNLFISLAESIAHNFVLCFWGNEYGIPLAMGGERAKFTRTLK
jgi:hypothetical protein